MSLDLGGGHYPNNNNNSSSRSPYQLFTRQSPASALPPDTWEDNTDSGKGSLSRGEYTPLNPDINKATPPRYGSLKRIKDPFKVSNYVLKFQKNAKPLNKSSSYPGCLNYYKNSLFAGIRKRISHHSTEETQSQPRIQR